MFFTHSGPPDSWSLLITVFVSVFSLFLRFGMQNFGSRRCKLGNLMLFRLFAALKPEKPFFAFKCFFPSFSNSAEAAFLAAFLVLSAVEFLQLPILSLSYSTKTSRQLSTPFDCFYLAVGPQNSTKIRGEFASILKIILNYSIIILARNMQANFAKKIEAFYFRNLSFYMEIFVINLA